MNIRLNNVFENAEAVKGTISISKYPNQNIVEWFDVVLKQSPEQEQRRLGRTSDAIERKQRVHRRERVAAVELDVRKQRGRVKKASSLFLFHPSFSLGRLKMSGHTINVAARTGSSEEKYRGQIEFKSRVCKLHLREYVVSFSFEQLEQP